jgi:hypothetical protein
MNGSHLEVHFWQLDDRIGIGSWGGRFGDGRRFDADQVADKVDVASFFLELDHQQSVGMFVQPQEQFVFVQFAQRTVGGEEQWHFLVDGDGKMLQRLLTPALRDPETQLADDRLETRFVPVQRLLQVIHQCRGRIVLFTTIKC